MHSWGENHWTPISHHMNIAHGQVLSWRERSVCIRKELLLRISQINDRRRPPTDGNPSAA
eukprot:1343197-Amphidinium_carterae.1